MSSDLNLASKLAVEYTRATDHVSMRLSYGPSNFETQVELADSEIDAHHAWWHSYAMGNHLKFPEPRKSLRVADLFSGPGGLSQGVLLAARSLGFKVQHQLAVDIDREALRVYAANHNPRLVINDSTASLVSYTLNESTERSHFHGLPHVRDERVAAMRDQVDMLIAGPPCQGHSTANRNRRFFEHKNLLYLTVPALAVALNVPLVIIENVPGVQASEQGVAQRAWDLLESHGYVLTGAVINAAQLGWAQRRRRYFMVACKGSSPLDLGKVVLPALKREEMAIRHLLSDLVDVDATSFMTTSPELSADNLERIRILHEGNLHDLPDEHRNQSAKQNGTTYPSVYGRMYWDKAAQTITTGFMTPGRGRYVHPLRQRTLLPLEAARLQGFPDTYIFDAFGEVPARTALAKWIGDAVPSPLGFAAAVSALMPLSVT
jgi:DNA (cytosine-5)-methyltransferase 1